MCEYRYIKQISLVSSNNLLFLNCTVRFYGTIRIFLYTCFITLVRQYVISLKFISYEDIGNGQTSIIFLADFRLSYLVKYIFDISSMKYHD